MYQPFTQHKPFPWKKCLLFTQGIHLGREKMDQAVFGKRSQEPPAKYPYAIAGEAHLTRLCGDSAEQERGGEHPPA